MNKSPNPSNSNGAHDPQEELRQQLWELAYDLLDDDAAAALRAWVKSDPAVARLYAEVRLQSDLVAAASRVNDTGLNISIGPESKGAKTAAGKDGLRPQPARVAVQAQYAWTNWIAIGGTVALLLLLTIGLNQPQVAVNSIAKVDEYFFTIVAAPADMTEGLTQQVDVETRSVDGSGVEAELEVRLIDSEGRETFRKPVATAANGRAQVQLPGEVLTPGSKLEVRPADNKGDRERSVYAPLNIAPEEAQTVMLPEKPFARPGERVGFVVTRVKPFSKKTELPDADELMVESRAGDVSQPMWTTDPDSRTVYGELELPREESLRDLAVRMRQQPEPDARLRESVKADANRPAANGAIARLEKFYLHGYRATEEAQKRKSSNQPPELAAPRPAQPGLSAAGMPAPESGKNSSTNDQPPSTDPTRAARRTVDKPADGSASKDQAAALKSAVARADEKKASVAGMEPPAPATVPPPPAPSDSAVVPVPSPAGFAPSGFAPGAAGPAPGPAPGALTDRAGANQQLPGRNRAEPNEPAAQSAKTSPREAQLAKDNRPAGRGLLAPALPAPANAAPATALPPEAAPGPVPSVEGEQLAAGINGPKAELRKAVESPASKEMGDQSGIAIVKQGPNVIARKRVDSLEMAEKAKTTLPPEAQGELTYEYYSLSGTRPLMRERFLRESDRQLQIAIDGLKNSYRPGETVQLQLRVKDEQDRAVPAALGVRVWSDKAVRTTRAPLSLAAALESSTWEGESLREEAGAALAASSAMAAASPAVENAALEAKPTELPALQKQREEKQKQHAVAATEAPTEAPAEATPTPLEQPNVASARASRALGGPAVTFGAKKQEADEGMPQQSATELAEVADEKDGRWQTFQSVLAPDVIEADNRAQVERDYEMALAAARMERDERWQQFGRVMIWSAAGLLLVVGLFLLARQPVRMAVLVPAVGLSIVCLGLGLVWFLPHDQGGIQIAWHEELPKSTTTDTAGPAPATPAMAPAAPAAASGQNAMESSPGPAWQPAGGFGRQQSQQGQGVGGGRFAESSDAPVLPLPTPTSPDDLSPAPASSTARSAGNSNQQADARSFGSGRDNLGKGRGEQSAGKEADKLPAAKEVGAKESAIAKAGEANEPARAPAMALNLPRGGSFSGGAATGGSAPAIPSGAAGFKPQGELQKQPESASAENAEGQPKAPDSIFWRPLSAIDSDGTVTIEFTMPAIASDYVLLVDAIGNGRIGHLRQVIHSRESK